MRQPFWTAVGVVAVAVSNCSVSQAAPVNAVVAQGLLLGGSCGGKWKSDKAVAPSLRGGERFNVYEGTKKLGQAKGGKPVTNEVPCTDSFFVVLKQSAKGAIGDHAIALTGRWNVMPRRPQAIGSTNAYYRSEVARIVKSHGIANPEVRITSAFRIDLDNDRQDEVVISATRHKSANPEGHPSPNSSAGDYSIVFVRKVVQGKVKTIMLAEEYYPKARTFNAPTIFDATGVYDLNGDGRMELMVEYRYYEGSGVEIKSIWSGKPVTLLSSGCGA